MNKLETELSQNDLNCLFSQKVEEVDNNHFYIRTKTHKIHIKNPKITWEKPYTEPKQTKIELVDTTETFIGATSPSRTELFFHGVASIENFPDLALFDSVILNSPIIEPIELLKNKQFSYNLDYHLYDFGTGQDIDLYDDEKSLSQKEWNAMFEQGVPTINTKNPIVFTADIEAVPLPVNKTIEFVIPGTERKLVIDVDSTRKNCLVDIFVSPWVDENRLVLRVEYEDGQIDNACITMNSQIFATIDKEHPNKSDVEDWLNQLTAHKTFIEWIVNQTQWSIEDVSLLPDDVENIWISKPITLSESNTAQVTINIGRMNKTYVVKLAKPLDVDYLKAIVEFPVNDDDFVVSLRPSTQVKCTSGFTLSEHIAVPETTQLGSILKSGVKEARTALNKHNQ